MYNLAFLHLLCVCLHHFSFFFWEMGIWENLCPSHYYLTRVH